MIILQNNQLLRIEHLSALQKEKEKRTLVTITQNANLAII